MRTLTKEPERENAEAVSADLLALPDVTQPADVLWLHLFYHALHTALIRARGATSSASNPPVYAPLQPAGDYIIVDHAAPTPPAHAAPHPPPPLAPAPTPPPRQAPAISQA